MNSFWHSVLLSMLFFFTLSVFAKDTDSASGQSGWRNALQPTGHHGSELTFVDHGKSNYRILIPSNPISLEDKAAQELQFWLGEMTGAKLPILRENESKGSGNHIISIGWTKELEKSQLACSPKDLGDEGYGIGVSDTALFLWGGRTRGILNAVYALLEEDLGCRWYSIKCTRIPSRSTLKFAPVPRTYTPRVKLRDPFYYGSFNGMWSLRNRANAPSAKVPEKWGGHQDYGQRFVHTFHTLMPPEKYFEQHPDYYMLDKNGKRDSWQLCTTHPEVIKLVTQEVRRFLKKSPYTEIVSVSKSDGGKTCLCKRCKALDDAEGSHMAALLVLVNAVAEAIEQEYPHVVVSTLAYQETVQVPKTMRPNKNVGIRLCNAGIGSWKYPFTAAEEMEFGKLVKAWGAVHDSIYIWDYIVNFSHYMAPMPNMEVVAENIRFYVDNNVEGILTQGNCQSPGGEREWLRSWVIAKLMWDPSRDVYKLMEDFIWGYYGKAAPAIDSYNKLLREQGKKYKKELVSPQEGIRYLMNNPFLSKSFLNKSTDLFDQAEQLADNKMDLSRVQEARLPIMYVKLVRGPDFVGDDYGDLLDRFEKISHRTGVQYLAEEWQKGPDLDKKIEGWRKLWQDYSTGNNK